MNNIIVAFPKEDVARNIKKILAQSGYSVVSVCTTGAQALTSVNNLETGIIVCGYRFVDMMYTEVYEYLPKGFQMLLIASPTNVIDNNVENLISLSLPLKVHELMQTVEMMDGYITRYKKRQKKKPKIRSEAELEIIDRAKRRLMERNGLSEEEAHRYIQKRSMEDGTGLVEISEMILSLMSEI